MEAFVGSAVYFKCPERSWVPGTLDGWDGHTGTCRAAEGSAAVVPRLRAEDLHPMQDGHAQGDIDDLLLLTELHDATLLDCVRRRYANDVIYTNIGAIVVALNPFKYTIPRYQEGAMAEYLAEGDTIEKSLPHSWATAHNTYHEMLAAERNQTILVSGESGAGKTEAAKIVLRYLAAVACRQAPPQDLAVAQQVGDRINVSSLPLEAFGNAKTVRNDNSSRFGKFMQAKFDSRGYLVGANIQKYLLEKSRIVTAADGERVYHAFYLLLRSDARESYGLGEASAYRTVSSGKQLTNKEYDTAEEFEEVNAAMRRIGVGDTAIDALWRTLAGILMMENVDFAADGEGSQLKPGSERLVASVCGLWGIDAAEALEQLHQTTLLIAGKPVKRLLSVAAASDGRSALSKALYDAAFSWLVGQCNLLLDVDDCKCWIGLLDIFGFEDFKVNSFEQVCINLTNETLQHHYNSYIFCRDVEECKAEGVDMTGVPFPDNTPCLELLTARGGVLSLLDDECQLGSGTDAAFFEKLCGAHRSHPFFDVKRTARTSFVIKHYAGDVSYDTTDFREKNLDTLKDAWKTLLRSSHDPLIQTLLPAPVDAKGAKPTVGGLFKRQLSELMAVINNTNPHWIRCVKPHPAKKPLMFDGPSVLRQLASSGVLGTVKIRKAGYPVRIPHSAFTAQFRIIAATAGQDPSPASIIRCCGFGKQEAQLGTRRVFLRSHVFLDLELKRKVALASSAATVQACAHAVAAYRGVQKTVQQQHRAVIEHVRKLARALVQRQVAEQEAREALLAEEVTAMQRLRKQRAVSEDGAHHAMLEREAAILAALADIHSQQQDEILDTELTYRSTLVEEWAAGVGAIMARWAASYQLARERSARREHKQAEQLLMRERRDMREARREREFGHVLQKSAERAAPTFRQQDRAVHAVQRQIAAKAAQLENQEQRALVEQARRQTVDDRMRAKEHQAGELRQEREVKRWHQAQEMARVRAAEERIARVQREDVEWQRLEARLVKGQQLALEEQRRLYLRSKAAEDQQRRAQLRADEERLKRQREQELAAERRAQGVLETERRQQQQREDRRKFTALQDFRKELRLRERAKQVERSIAWDNDRRERMALVRPDLGRQDMEELPLAARLGAPEPFIMANGCATTGKVWAPFRVIRFQASPAAGVALGGPFTVSWITTREQRGCTIVVMTGTGVVERRPVRDAVGDASFTAPSEWFSELEVELQAGGRTLASATISKVVV